MCLKYGKSQPKRAYKARAYKKKECIELYTLCIRDLKAL